MIQSLINPVRYFDLVKRAIGTILLTESPSQQALAAESLQDSKLWKLRVFEDRSDVLAMFEPDDTGWAAPIVVVSSIGWDNDSKQTTDISRFARKCSYSIDCYGYGEAKEKQEGHDLGEIVAEAESNRACALVEKILNAAEYLNLGLDDQVGDRVLVSMRIGRPEDHRSSSTVTVSRLILEVTVIESSPQMQPITIGGVNLAIKDSNTGELLASAEYRSQ